MKLTLRSLSAWGGNRFANLGPKSDGSQPPPHEGNGQLDIGGYGGMPRTA